MSLCVVSSVSGVPSQLPIGTSLVVASLTGGARRLALTVPPSNSPTASPSVVVTVTPTDGSTVAAVADMCVAGCVSSSPACLAAVATCARVAGGVFNDIGVVTLPTSTYCGPSATAQSSCTVYLTLTPSHTGAQSPAVLQITVSGLDAPLLGGVRLLEGVPVFGTATNGHLAYFTFDVPPPTPSTATFADVVVTVTPLTDGVPLVLVNANGTAPAVGSAQFTSLTTSSAAHALFYIAVRVPSASFPPCTNTQQCGAARVTVAVTCYTRHCGPFTIVVSRTYVAQRCARACK